MIHRRSVTGESSKRIAILGAGAIGTLFAFLFARKGHDVTLIARGARLEALRAAKGRIRVRAGRGAIDEITVSVSDSLDVEPAPDLLLVAVRRQHADALLASVARSLAAQIMFMFNIAADLSRFRDAVGSERFSWGFPAAVARFEDEVLVYSVVPAAMRWMQITTLGGVAGLEPPGLVLWQSLLAQVDIPFAVCPDMTSWLETHAAFMAPLVSASVLSGARRLALRDARLVARAMHDGFGVVRAAGGRLLPRNMALFRRVPTFATGCLLWLAFGSERVRASLGGGHAAAEATAMLDDLAALSPDHGVALDELRRRLAAAS